jgi:hypothetical protein
MCLIVAVMRRNVTPIYFPRVQVVENARALEAKASRERTDSVLSLVATHELTGIKLSHALFEVRC